MIFYDRKLITTNEANYNTWTFKFNTFFFLVTATNHNRHYDALRININTWLTPYHFLIVLIFLISQRSFSFYIFILMNAFSDIVKERIFLFWKPIRFG